MALGFWNCAKADPDKVFVVEPDGTEWTGRQLLDESARWANALTAAGLETGDVVTSLLPNSATYVLLYLACFRSGLYLTPINYHLAGPEVAYIVNDSDARVFVAHERFADIATKAATEIGEGMRRVSIGSIDGFEPEGAFRGDASTDLPAGTIAGSTMHYTSGTTGRPKGVKRPLGEVDADLSGELMTFMIGLFGITPGGANVHLVVAPCYHTAVTIFGGGSLHMGHKLVLMDRWTPEGCLEAIDRHHVTHSHMVPTMFHRMLALPDEVKARYDVSSMTHAIHSAAPCPIEVKQAMLEWWGDCIYEYYGATEGGGTLVTPEQWKQKPGTVGTPWPISTIKIFDDDGNAMPPGEAGTVWMSMGVEFEYKGDAGKTEKSWKDGFFTVGDAGYLDEDGWLFLVDRKADMIIAGGVNIYPAEIEAAIVTAPGVGDVAVFGVPNDDLGEEVKAVVEPAEGVDGDDALRAAIMDHLSERLGKQKWPRSIDFVDQLPRDPNGKLYKRKLRDPHWEGRTRQI